MFRAITFGSLGARARLALPVGLCLFGALTADCTKVTKPKGACWGAYNQVAAMGWRFYRRIFYQVSSYVDTISGAEKRRLDLAWNEFLTENGIAPFVSSCGST
jgi:hypothetical protein